MLSQEYICNNPQCHDGKELTFTVSNKIVTLISWSPMFDMKGRPLNADPNERKTFYACDRCKMAYVRWQREWMVRFFVDHGDERYALVGERDDTPEHLKMVF